MSTTAAAALKVLEQDSGGACCGGGGCCGSSAAEAVFGSELYSAAQRDDAFGNHQSSRACRLTRLRLRPSQLPVIVRMTNGWCETLLIWVRAEAVQGEPYQRCADCCWKEPVAEVGQSVPDGQEGSVVDVEAGE